MTPDPMNPDQMNPESMNPDQMNPESMNPDPMNPDSVTTLPTFDAAGDLPSGTTVLEASAGTGKTWTIAALAARYLADGIPLEQLLLVTFSRAATKELRLRIRARLVETEAALRTHLAGSAVPDPTDPIVALLIGDEPDIVAQRAHRLSVALDEFDDATIATIHEFCARMLDGLGVLARTDPDRTFADSLDELTAEVTTDLYLKHHADQDRPSLSPTNAAWIARDVVAHPECELVPGRGSPECRNATITARVEFAHDVRDEVRRRQRAQRLVTHDDLLTELRDSLTDPVTGPDAVDLLRARYRVVLVDEFQDTDPVQWDIVHRAFHGHTTLILIGDPKQAIYRFRGADVQAYLAAVSAADRHGTLTTNWRSDEAVVDAVDELFAGAALGDPRIVVRPVRASHTEPRVRTAHGPATPIRIRALTSPEGEENHRVNAIRPVVINDVVAQIDQLLNDGTQTCPDGEQWREVEPRDIAVLVNRNRTATAVVRALVDAGIPAVQTGGASIFSQEMAQHWLTLLQALSDPRAGTNRRAALTPFIGWDFARLATAGEDDLAELAATIQGWARLVSEQGAAALTESLMTSHDLPARLLAHPEGDRMITDLRHIGELLHARMRTEHLGLVAATDWLADSIRHAARTDQDDQHRRLETDTDAVHVLTVHGSKGLEYGFVLLPEAWDHHLESRDNDKGRVLQFHSPDGAVMLDVGGQSAPGRDERHELWRAEEAGDTLRSFYVAATRARHQVITWWVPSYNTSTSALHRLLYGPRTPGVVPPERAPRPGGPDQLNLDARRIGIEVVDPATIGSPVRSRRRFGIDPSLAEDLSARAWTRVVDHDWRRTSYSALTAAAHDHPEARGNDEVGLSDEPQAGPDEPGTAPAPATDPAATVASPMGDLPAGTEFGTIMHAIYEHADATAADLRAELRQRTAAELTRTPYPVDAEALADALVPAFRTPLGPLADDRRLCDFAVTDRLSELDFELPLAGGDQPRPTRVTVADLAAVLAVHVADHPHLHAYPAMLAAEPTGGQVLRGFLTGSIDSVLRVSAPGGGPDRHLVVDYKSNWLGEFGQPLTVASYHPDRVAEAMMRAHYPLQALLYSVALHRFLSWRLPGYDPATHLGGIAYLFVRGMAGPDTPTVDGVPYGVFSWDPGPELVIALSDLLSGTIEQEVPDAH